VLIDFPWWKDGVGVEKLGDALRRAVATVPTNPTNINKIPSQPSKKPPSHQITYFIKSPSPAHKKTGAVSGFFGASLEKLNTVQ